MNGGVISDNSVISYGGGVYSSGTFTMNGGVISGNSSAYGGGVYMISSYILNKTGGTIYGYSGNPEDPYSNKAGIGHAVFVSFDYRKETTLGPTDDLTYNYPSSGEHSGW
jgi:hypothetical protein